VVDAAEHAAPEDTFWGVRLALIANPRSGGGTDVGELALRLGGNGAVVSVHLPGQLDTVAAARPDRIVAAGGDGTIARAADLAGRLGVPLAVVPAGTANDFARSQGLPEDWTEATALASSPDVALRELDLGRLADGTPFVNVASAGLASVAARRASSLKQRLGALAYAAGALTAATGERPLTVTALADRAPAFHGDAWQVIVAVTGHFGGGSSLDPADPQDGILDLAVVPAGRRIGLARRALGMRTGGLTEQRDVTHVRGCEIELHLPAGTDLNVDGEIVRASSPERIRLDARAFELVVPPRSRRDPSA
jgi:diacylglycerol kinase family enzyme